MTYTELLQLAQQGKLILSRSDGNNHTRTIRIYKVKMPNLDKATGETWEAYENNPDKDIFTEKRVKYKKYFYGARTEDMEENQNYKITKKNYETFLSLSQS